MSRAKRTVLRQSDLIATFHVDRKRRGVPMIPHCGAYPGDRSNTTVTGEASSSFTDGFNLMGSRALFFGSQLDLEHYWQKTIRTRFATCDAYWLRHSARQGATARTLFAGALPLERTGADAAAAYRSVTHVTFAGHRTYDWYQTTIFVRVGRGFASALIAYRNQPCDCYTGIAQDLTERLSQAGRG
jgi:hypothetical protein